GIAADGFDDTVNLPVIDGTGIATPWLAVALQEQWFIVSAAFGGGFQSGGELRRDRHADVTVLLLAAVAAATLAASRHPQFRPQRMIVQVLDTEPDRLRRPRAGCRKHIDE